MWEKVGRTEPRAQSRIKNSPQPFKTSVSHMDQLESAELANHFPMGLVKGRSNEELT
jgi:hypothetical protein